MTLLRGDRLQNSNWFLARPTIENHEGEVVVNAFCRRAVIELDPGLFSALI